MNKLIFVHTEWIRPKKDLKSDFGWTLSADKKESNQCTYGMTILIRIKR